VDVGAKRGNGDCMRGKGKRKAGECRKCWDRGRGQNAGKPSGFPRGATGGSRFSGGVSGGTGRSENKKKMGTGVTWNSWGTGQRRERELIFSRKKRTPQDEVTAHRKAKILLARGEGADGGGEKIWKKKKTRGAGGGARVRKKVRGWTGSRRVGRQRVPQQRQGI